MVMNLRVPQKVGNLTRCEAIIFWRTNVLCGVSENFHVRT
jgi:hypothetical protein